MGFYSRGLGFRGLGFLLREPSPLIKGGRSDGGCQGLLHLSVEEQEMLVGLRSPRR